MSTGPTATEEEILEGMKGLNYGLVLTLTLWTYDWIITLRQEIVYVWGAPWTPGKVLLIVVRYAGLMALLPYVTVPFSAWTNDKRCDILVYSAYCTQLLLQIASGLVLALRTWAIWNRDRICGIIVGLAWLGLVVSLAVLFAYITDLLPCSSTSFPVMTPALKTMKRSFIALAIYEGVILVMTLPRAATYFHRNTPPLTVILYRDAFLASMCLSIFAIGSAILSAQEASSFYIVDFLSVVFYSVCPGRIMLNLREATRELDEWDLTRTMPDVGHSIDADLRSSVASDSSGWSDVASSERAGSARERGEVGKRPRRRTSERLRNCNSAPDLKSSV